MLLRPATAVGAVAVGVAWLLLAAVPVLAAQSPATVRGKVAPGAVKLPKSSKKGSAQVLAVNVDTAAFGDAAAVDRRGRYALELPPGKWALRSSVVALDKPYAAFSSARIATRAGQRRSLPLTLKKFKKPRKKRRARVHGANVNRRDGRSYPGEAFGFEAFTVAGGDADFKSLGKGVPDMLITEVMQKATCEFTLVEWMRRDAVLAENAFSRSEHVDPATRAEPGHIIDPEILIRGRVEDRPGTPRRIAMLVWLVDAKTGARLSGDVSAVSLHDHSFFTAAERLAELVVRDLICARATRPPPPPPAPGAGPPAPPPPPPPGPPLPPAAPNSYTGTLSGEADSGAARSSWTWSGEVHLDAAQDDAFPFFPPNGAPPGNYRLFTVTSGSVDLSVVFTDPGCTYTGSRQVEIPPGLVNTLALQLDVPDPAYTLSISGDVRETIPLVKVGPNCPGGSSEIPIWPLFATTGLFAHFSPSTTLADSQAELTPETPFDDDYTTRWNLTPG